MPNSIAHSQQARIDRIQITLSGSGRNTLRHHFKDNAKYLALPAMFSKKVKQSH